MFMHKQMIAELKLGYTLWKIACHMDAALHQLKVAA